MNFDYLNYPYSSQRKVSFAQNGMVATSQPLAAQAGLNILQNGGNAVDAAIATAACLTVVEPTSNGIGGDAFALIWNNGKLHGINGSGHAPQNISIQKLKKKGYDTIPAYDWPSVTVPGIPGTWAELSSKFGSLPFEKILEPAIKYADQGFPVSPTTGESWKKAYKVYKKQLSGKKYDYWFKTFAPGGTPPEIGEIWKSKAHARTLKSIAETKAKSFYKGKIADKIIKFSRENGGFLSRDDLEKFSPDWVNPINIDYRGYKVWELPPNGQGLIALMALNILKEYKFENRESIDTYHKQLEAIKLAFSDGKKYITDPEDMSVEIESLLSNSYARKRSKLINNKAKFPEPGKPVMGGTVYLATADNQGNMVSFIQSNYKGFGSGLVVPKTGIALQNRGHLFSMNPEAENCLKPGKRTYHTIIPGFLSKDEKSVGPFGVMGGYMQPQGHVQVIMNSIDFGLNPQTALDAPRWYWQKGKKIKVEPNFPENIAKKLERKGHKIEIEIDRSIFGRGQIIWKNQENGVLSGATEPRTDGLITGC